MTTLIVLWLTHCVAAVIGAVVWSLATASGGYRKGQESACH